MDKRPLLIAEVKTQSPFGWRSKLSWDELFAIANESGDMISVHTDSRWGGSFDLVKKARTLTKKPILAKGLHETEEMVEEAIRSGADYVLVVGRIPLKHRDQCIVEPLTLQGLRDIPPDMRAVWNSRDLSDGSQKKETFAEARAAFSGWLCQASNIKTLADVKEGADAILVGACLEEFVNSLGKYGR